MTQTQDIVGELQAMQDRILALQAMTQEVEVQPLAGIQQLAVATPTSLPVPSASDNPNVPRDMLALATALDNVTVPVFATTAARDAARTAGATFNVCFVASTPYRWYGTAWGQLVNFPQYFPSVVMNGPALPAGGGTLGLCATPLSVPAVAYPRLLTVTHVMTLQTSTALCQFAIRRDGAAVSTIRLFTNQTTVRNDWTELVPANVAHSYDATINSAAAAAPYGNGTGTTDIAALSAIAWPQG